MIGVIDTGVDYNHPDLAANIWTNPGEIPGNGIDDDGNGYVDDVHGWDFVNDDNDPMDDNGHGTHCSGTIGGVGNNGIGVAGVNWNVKIVGIKFLSSGGIGSTTDAIVGHPVRHHHRRAADQQLLGRRRLLAGALRRHQRRRAARAAVRGRGRATPASTPTPARTTRPATIYAEHHRGGRDRPQRQLGELLQLRRRPRSTSPPPA